MKRIFDFMKTNKDDIKNVIKDKSKQLSEENKELVEEIYNIQTENIR